MQSRKTKNVQISFDGLYANNLQNLCNPFSYAQNSEKLKKYQNLTTKWVKIKNQFLTGKISPSSSVPIRTQAVSIKARFKPKGRAHGYLGTISTVSDQYFLSSEENYRWGQADPPPPKQELG